MKKGIAIFGSLILALAFCVPAVAQPSSRAVETIVIDNFDTPDNMDWTWDVQTSRFITKGYPLVKSFQGVPNSLRPFVKDVDQAKVLGVKTAYDRKGDNWFIVYPKNADGTEHEIEFTGTVTRLDFWVWGATYNYNLEVLVRDANGIVRSLDCGSLAFSGWKNMVINVPGWILQHNRLRDGRKNLTFVGFRICAAPDEAVDNFVVYFDNLKYVTNTLSNIYDGYDLRDADFGDKKDGQ